MREYFADLHIHVGRSRRGEVVKVTGAKDLTLLRILEEAVERKGLDVVGLVDCHSPAVLDDLREEAEAGRLIPLAGGGLRFRDVVLFPGTEVEVKPPGRSPFHLLAFFPTLKRMQAFSAWMVSRVTNLTLSTQLIRATPEEVQGAAKELDALLIPAHIFTPYKGVYGSVDSLREALRLDLVDGVELGLSADTPMASQVGELDPFPFLSNSDAHSLGKIAREYTAFAAEGCSFAEFAMALKGRRGRRITANYGIHPELGKYHRTHCLACRQNVDLKGERGGVCPRCGQGEVVRGVWERMQELAALHPPGESKRPDRPPYRYHVPLEQFPGVGKKTLDRLCREVGTEMHILHRAPLEEIAAACGSPLAEKVAALRQGRVRFQAGGGGRYGKPLF